MAKQDIEIPERPPKKRRQLKQAPDVALATWLARDDLTPPERRKVQEEKEARKKVELPVVVYLKPAEGWTPSQQAMAGDMLPSGGCEIQQWVSDGLEDYHFKIKTGSAAIAFPKEMSKPLPIPPKSVWAAIRHCRHRGVPVRVVLPDGSEFREE